MVRAKSVLQKLKNKSRKSGISFQLLLQLFCQEEFLRRVSYSRYKESLILKGGLFLFTLTNFESRPTMDIDFLLRNHSNDEQKMLLMIQNIIGCDKENDFVNYEIKGLQPITEHKKYHGQRVKMRGVIDKTKTPFDIDFGIGDIVIPRPEIRELNVQLDGFSKPEIFTYSLESTIAEKWDAIIDRMQFNSRMKDFYDIYYLANHYDYDGRKLQEAIYETLNNRGRIYERDTIDKVKALGKDKEILSRWNAFTRNTLDKELDFELVLDKLILFIKEPFNAILNEEELLKGWESGISKWE